MQHRQPRLGDILDDYCPRERRITNHAVVAMVGPDIKQVRCTTCDAEHEYKHAKVPSTRKKKDAPTALYKQVLASAQPEAVRGQQKAGESEGVEEQAAPPAALPFEAEPPVEEAPAVVASAAEAPEQAERAQGEEEPDAQIEDGNDEGPVHRRLIRATLPRPEGAAMPPRPLPQFTVRQPGKFNASGGRGGSRPQGTGSMTRQRPSSARTTFGRNGSRSETFTTRPSGGSHHALQRSRPGHRPGGRPIRHGKKSPK